MVTLKRRLRNSTKLYEQMVVQTSSYKKKRVGWLLQG
jgi:hypothetical protein